MVLKNRHSTSPMFIMSTQYHRKCCKCGATAAQDVTISFFRFPKPGKDNILKAKAWAVYCWPDKNWGSVETLHLLHKQSKVLCGRHFEESCFLDSNKKRISKFAVPGKTEYVVKLISTLRRQAALELEGNTTDNISAAGPSSQLHNISLPACAKDKGSTDNVSAAGPSSQLHNINIKLPAGAKDKGISTANVSAAGPSSQLHNISLPACAKDKETTRSKNRSRVSLLKSKQMRTASCDQCKNAILQADSNEPVHIFTSFKEYNENKKSLKYVTTNLVQAVEFSACILNNLFRTELYKENIQILAMTALRGVDFQFLEVCRTHFI